MTATGGPYPVTYTDDEHEAWRARAEAAHPGRACLGCRYCDPIPGWSDPEPVGVTGSVRSRWIGTAPTILEDVHALKG